MSQDFARDDGNASSDYQNSENKGENGNQYSESELKEMARAAGKEEPCRDFIKNICNRGSKCKFFHPPGMGMNAPDSTGKEEINFCLDFQNKGCNRDSCRYVHAFREDAEHYRATGDISHELACAIAAVTMKDTINGIPFCKEYLSGSCSRGNRCRYWHIDPQEQRARRKAGGGPPIGRGGPYGGPGGYGRMPPPRRGGGRYDDDYSYYRGGGGGGGYRGGGGDYDYADYRSQMKRPRYDGPPGPAERVSPAYASELERKNRELLAENDQLKMDIKRIQERHDELYSLYYRTGPSGAAGGVSGGGPTGIAPAAGAPATVMTSAAAAPTPTAGVAAAAQALNAATDLVVSLAQATASIAAPAMQQMAPLQQMSMAPTAMAPSADAMAWSMHR